MHNKRVQGLVLIVSDDTNFAGKIDGLCEVEFFGKRSVHASTWALTKNEQAQGAILTQNSIKNKGQQMLTLVFVCRCTRLRATPPSVTTTDSSRTAPSRHTQIHTYRCFRQDLTRFVRFMLRKNPSFNTSYCGQASQETPSGREFIPYIADLWLQDAATFPTSTWRREGDSNPWYA